MNIVIKRSFLKNTLFYIPYVIYLLYSLINTSFYAKYISSYVVNSMLEKHVINETEFLNVLSAMKEKARVDFNKAQEDKESANGEDSIVAHAEYEILSVVEAVAREYLTSNK